MEIPEAQKKLNKIISDLPTHKLEVLIDFASYIKDREEMDDFFRMQARSKAYEEWVSAENDIYDEVFGDEIKEG